MNKNEVRINRKILIVEIFRLMIVIIVHACAFKIKKVIRKDILCFDRFVNVNCIVIIETIITQIAQVFIFTICYLITQYLPTNLR